MNNKMLLFLSVFLVLGLESVVSAATYTVCSSGCNYTTIQGAFNGVDLAPGDIVEVRADTPPGGTKYYNETVTPGANDAGDAIQQVTLKARTGDTIYIDCQDTRDNAIWLNNVSYVTVDGFYIDNCNLYSIRLNGSSSANRITGVIAQNLHVNVPNNSALANSHEGIYLRYGQDVNIRNNTITTDAMSVSYQTDCIYVQNSNVTTVDGNQCTIRNNDSTGHNDCVQFFGDVGLGSGVVVKNNICIQDNTAVNNKQCIYVEAHDGDVSIYNNVLYSTSTLGSNCISVAPKATAAPGITKIYNNTIYLNGLGVAIKTDEFINNPYVKNNACHINSSTGYCIDLRSTTLTPTLVNNNISFKTSGDINFAAALSLTWAEWQTLGFDANGLNANPQLALSPPEVLLHLMPISPAINAGAVLTEFTTDRDGNPRGAILWDMGAYETDTLAPAAPVLINVQ